MITLLGESLGPAGRRQWFDRPASLLPFRAAALSIIEGGVLASPAVF